MGLFGFLKNKEAPAPAADNTSITLGAPVVGVCVPMGEVPDEVFSQGIMGVCCGVDPSEGRVYAPADGKVSQLTDTLHAIGMEVNGIEVLIHVGVDTVDMNGDGFENAVKLGQTVKKGDLLLTMDLEKIRAAGHPATVIMAVTNSDDFASVRESASGTVRAGECVLQISR